MAFKADGEIILLIGNAPQWLGRSMYLQAICGREEGAPPPVDLALERAHGDFVRAAIAEGWLTAVHDVADGGLLLAIAEMAMASGIGAILQPPPAGLVAHGFWFGEDQARYIVTVEPSGLDPLRARADAASIAWRRLGTTAAIRSFYRARSRS